MIGTRINNYEIRSLLGEGGMGAVYLAENPMIGRRVAVKVLRGDLARNPGLVSRFVNEARAANAIRHPNIIEIFDAGTLPAGEPYLIMEYLDGENLSQRLSREARLPLAATTSILAQAASALGAAHTKGIVHRDLKPDNLFLLPDPVRAGRSQVKVLDFGIAKLKQELTPATVQTNTGAVLGTPYYMSPEQCRGVSSAIDHRSDVYSLGVILFQMLCGSLPFVSEGVGDVLIMQATKPPPRPRSLNPAIPPAVEAVILRALSKEPEARYQSMADFAGALAQATGGVTPPPAAVGESSIEARMLIAAPTDPSLRVTPPSPVPTTFSNTAGELQESLAATRALRRRRRILAIGGAAVVGSVLAFAITRKNVSPTAIPPSPASARSAAASGAAMVARVPTFVVPVATPDAGAAVPRTTPGETPPPAASVRRESAGEPTTKGSARPSGPRSRAGTAHRAPAAPAAVIPPPAAPPPKPQVKPEVF